MATSFLFAGSGYAYVYYKASSNLAEYKMMLENEQLYKDTTRP